MAYLNYKTENETSHCLNEFWQDLHLGLLLVPSIKVMAKTLLMLSEKPRHNAKFTWEEGGKASTWTVCKEHTEFDLHAHSLDQRRTENICDLSGAFPQ